MTVETFTQPAADGIPEVEVVRVHEIQGHADMSRAAFEDYQSRQAARWAKGRYTLEEAAMQIVENTDADARTMLEKLILAVRNQKLPVHGPNKVDLYRPEKVLVWFEEAYWDDLNAWLTENEKRIEWRFPKPELGGDEPKLRAQEKAILAALVGLGHDPKALPPYEAGKPGVKDACRQAIADSLLLAAQIRLNLAENPPVWHSSKRDTAALTAMPDGIAPTPRQGCASPGCKRPQPALDPAPGLVVVIST